MILIPILLAAAMLACAQEPELPFTYIQSGFTTNDPPMWFCATPERKKLRVEGISQFFDGSEVLDLDVDTVAGRQDVRDLAGAMREVSEEQQRMFVGFWSFPRLPGFFRPDDIAAQPADYRALSLKADGSVWHRAPLPRMRMSRRSSSPARCSTSRTNRLSRSSSPTSPASFVMTGPRTSPSARCAGISC
jgi:hypothetical protein